jgi:hypothetical protein
VIIRVIDNGLFGGVSRLATPPDVGSKPLGVGVEVSELERAVGDGEDVVLSLGEADIVSGEIAREKERLASPLDVAGSIDQSYEGVLGIDECGKTSWVRTRGRGVEMCRRFVLRETLVRPVVVVFCSEAVESLLLGREGF